MQVIVKLSFQVALYGPVKVCKVPLIEWRSSLFLLINVGGSNITFQLSVKPPVE